MGFWVGMVVSQDAGDGSKFGEIIALVFLWGKGGWGVNGGEMMTRA